MKMCKEMCETEAQLEMHHFILFRKRPREMNELIHFSNLVW